MMTYSSLDIVRVWNHPCNGVDDWVDGADQGLGDFRECVRPWESPNIW